GAPVVLVVVVQGAPVVLVVVVQGAPVVLVVVVQGAPVVLVVVVQGAPVVLVVVVQGAPVVLVVVVRGAPVVLVVVVQGSAVVVVTGFDPVVLGIRVVEHGVGGLSVVEGTVGQATGTPEQLTSSGPPVRKHKVSSFLRMNPWQTGCSFCQPLQSMHICMHGSDAATKKDMPKTMMPSLLLIVERKELLRLCILAPLREITEATSTSNSRVLDGYEGKDPVFAIIRRQAKLEGRGDGDTPTTGLQFWTMGFLLLLGAGTAGTIVWLYHPAKRASVGGVVADVFVFTGELVSLTARGGGGSLKVVMKGKKRGDKVEEFAQISSEGGREQHTFTRKAGAFTWVIGEVEDVDGPDGEVLAEIFEGDEVIADGRIDLKDLYKEGRLTKDMQESIEIKIPVQGGTIEEIVLNGKLAKGSNFHEALRYGKSIFMGVKRAGIFGIAAYGICAVCGVFGNFMVGGMFLFGGCTSQSTVALVGMVILAALVLPTLSAWGAADDVQYDIAKNKMFLARVSSQLKALVLIILGTVQIVMAVTGGTETCSPLFTTLGSASLVNSIFFIIVFVKDEVGGDIMALVKPNCLLKGTRQEPAQESRTCPKMNVEVESSVVPERSDGGVDLDSSRVYIGLAGMPPPPAADQGSTSVKLFVRGLPIHYPESDLRAVFEEYGVVEDVFILRDRSTMQSRGMAFVRFRDIPCGMAAIKALNGTQLPRSDSHIPLSVLLAQGEAERLGMPGEAVPTGGDTKLFVSGLGPATQEPELRTIFEPYGRINEIHVPGPHALYAFVRFADKEDALKAIGEVNGRVTVEGSQRPLEVKVAESRAAKADRNSHHHQHHYAGGGYDPTTSSSGYGGPPPPLAAPAAAAAPSR
ncbi:hypothetical protein FOZ63_016068, partial [Perkinsus olseni]